MSELYEVLLRYTYGTMEFPIEKWLGVCKANSADEAIEKAKNNPYIKGLKEDYDAGGSDYTGQKFMDFTAYLVRVKRK